MDNLWLSACELLLSYQSVQETQLVQVSKPKLNMEWKWISFLTLVKLIILMWDESWGSNVKQLQIFVYVSSSQCGSNRELTLHLTPSSMRQRNPFTPHTRLWKSRTRNNNRKSFSHPRAMRNSRRIYGHSCIWWTNWDVNKFAHGSWPTVEQRLASFSPLLECNDSTLVNWNQFSLQQQQEPQPCGHRG